MTASVCDDAGLVEFAEPAALRPFLDAAAAVARDTVAQRRPARTAELVRGLGMAEVIDEMPATDAAALVFHVARIVAHADPAGAWLGLRDALPVLLGLPAGSMVAMPSVAATAWVACLSSPGANADGIWVANPAGARLWRVPGHEVPELPLAALPGARQVLLRADVLAGLSAGDERALPMAAWRVFTHAQGALLGGLLSGACQRLVNEAFAYAQQRQSGGKAIAQHQAVALRLAEIAMQHEAMGMYLACIAEGLMTSPGQALSSHVGATARGIARDALQTAAAHGYVEGLAFKRLFEEVHALCALFNAWGQSSMLSIPEEFT